MGGTWFGLSTGPYLLLAVTCVLLGYVAGTKVVPVRHAATVAAAVAISGSAVVATTVAASNAAGVVSLVAAGLAATLISAAAVYGLMVAYRLARPPRVVCPSGSGVRPRSATTTAPVGSPKNHTNPSKHHPHLGPETKTSAPDPTPGGSTATGPAFEDERDPR